MAAGGTGSSEKNKLGKNIEQKDMAPKGLRNGLRLVKTQDLRQHRTIAAAGFDGSFPLEIHKVFRRFRNKFVT